MTGLDLPHIFNICTCSGRALPKNIAIKTYKYTYINMYINAYKHTDRHTYIYYIIDVINTLRLEIACEPRQKAAKRVEEVSFNQTMQFAWYNDSISHSHLYLITSKFRYIDICTYPYLHLFICRHIYSLIPLMISF